MALQTTIKQEGLYTSDEWNMFSIPTEWSHDHNYSNPAVPFQDFNLDWYRNDIPVGEYTQSDPPVATARKQDLESPKSTPENSEALPSNEHQKIEVTLNDMELWQRLHEITNEMTITNDGKQLFPTLAYDVKGLKPNSNYCMSLHLRRTSSYKWKYDKMKNEWEPDFKQNGMRVTNKLISDTKTGDYWMRNGISFSYVKVYNIGSEYKNKKRKILTSPEKRVEEEKKKKTMLLVEQMIKYIPVLQIYEFSEETSSWMRVNEEKIFDETEFVVVTEYRNPVVQAIRSIECKTISKSVKNNAKIFLDQYYNGSVPTSSNSKTRKRRRICFTSSDGTTLEDSPDGSFESKKSPTSFESSESKSESSDVIGSTQSSTDGTSGRTSPRSLVSTSEDSRPTSSIDSSTSSRFEDFSFSDFGGSTPSEHQGSRSFGASGFMLSSFFPFSSSVEYKATPSSECTTSKLEDSVKRFLESKKCTMPPKFPESKFESSDVIESTHSSTDDSLGRTSSGSLESTSEDSRPSSSIDSSTSSEFGHFPLSGFAGCTSSEYPRSMHFDASGFTPSTFYGFPPSFGYDATTTSASNGFMNFGFQPFGIMNTTFGTDGFMNSGVATSSDHQNLQNYECMSTEEAKPEGFLNTNWNCL